MPVPEALDWPPAGGFPEVFTTAHDALFTQAGLQRRRAPARARRRGRRRHRRGPARPRRRRARRRDRAQRGAARRRSPRSARTVDRARRLRGARALRRRSSSSSARPTCPTTSTRSPPAGASCVIGVGAGAKAELNLLRADGQARPHPRLDAARRARWRRRPRRPARVERHVLPLFDAARSPCRSPRPSRSTRVADAYERFAGRRQARQDRAARSLG